MTDENLNLQPASFDSGPKSLLIQIGGFFWELIKVFLIAVVIIVPIRYLLVQPFFVRGASMEPNFEDGQYLVVDELSYRVRQPQRGEVIVFRYPLDTSQFFIKRIIGLPGETVKVVDGRVTIQNAQYQQGVALDESEYLTSSVRTGGDINETLGSNEYFVLGDNRAASSDSRVWGAVPRSDIVGRAWLRAFPLDRLSVFSYTPPGFLNAQ